MASSTRSEVLVRCGISVVKKRNTTSVVWNYFGLRANPDGSVVRGEANYPVCRSCGKSVPAKGGNTTNLLTQLMDRYPDLYAKASPKVAKKSATAASSANENRQPTLLQSIKRSTKYGTHSSIAQELNRAVTYFLGFKHLVAKLNPRYELPSRKHFSEYELPKLYNHVRDSTVKPKLMQAEHFSATTDLWTSSATCSLYVSYCSFCR